MQTESHLQQQLEKLRTRLLVMCQAVGESVDSAGRAFITGDVALARKVMQGDAAIDALEDEIDSMALAILALYQPVARDLRFVVTALRMVIDLERIGDEASIMADMVISAHETPGSMSLPVPDEMRMLIGRVNKAYEEAVTCFKTESPVHTLKALDHDGDASTQAEVSALHKILQELSIEGNAYSLQVSLQLLLVARALSRIWRRADNIVEHCWFICRGESVKHRPPATQED